MKRLTALMALLVVLAGCSGTFGNQRRFQAYIDRMQLSHLSVADAAAKLSAEGFKCNPSADSAKPATVICQKSLRGSTGFYVESLQVDLSPAPDDPNKSIVISGMGTAVA